jgi:hypothetical protein
MARFINPDTARAIVIEGIVEFHLNHSCQWRVALSDIRIVGELMLEGGTFDWHWVFVSKTEELLWLPVGIDGEQDVIQSVREYLNTDLNAKFARFTWLDSRVVWPVDLVDEPLYREESALPWWLRPLDLVGLLPVSLVLTKQVQAYLESLDLPATKSDDPGAEDDR